MIPCWSSIRSCEEYISLEPVIIFKQKIKHHSQGRTFDLSDLPNQSIDHYQGKRYGVFKDEAHLYCCRYWACAGRDGETRRTREGFHWSSTNTKCTYWLHSLRWMCNISMLPRLRHPLSERKPPAPEKIPLGDPAIIYANGVFDTRLSSYYFNTA